MFTESKITEIYCMADDFCKEFALQQEKYGSSGIWSDRFICAISPCANSSSRTS